MLVLSRKIGEKLHIGSDIVLEVRRVAGNRVTIAVDAPKSVRILRGELRESIESGDSLPGTIGERAEADASEWKEWAEQRNGGQQP